MRSSESTPSRPERPIPLAVILVGDDDPRRCTGRRLVRWGLARELRTTSKRNPRAILLDPYAASPLSPADAPRARSAGVVAVDCSWNRLSGGHARGAPPPTPGSSGSARRLPLLLAGNPQHYGRVGELNTAEALAAALYVLGEPAAAARLLEGFAGGPAFLAMNRERLDRYARASSPDELHAEERSLFSR